MPKRASVMPRQAVLRTEGWRAVFEVQPFDRTDRYLDLRIELQLDPNFGQMVIRSVPRKINVADLPRLVAYLAQHIQQLQENPKTESPIFVPLELGFQLVAFSGEVREPDDGEFTIQLLLNVGKAEHEGTNVYLGGQAVVTVGSIYGFARDIQHVLDDYGLSG